jgi:hypothetical protein
VKSKIHAPVFTGIESHHARNAPYGSKPTMVMVRVLTIFPLFTLSIGLQYDVAAISRFVIFVAPEIVTVQCVGARPKSAMMMVLVDLHLHLSTSGKTARDDSPVAARMEVQVP